MWSTRSAAAHSILATLLLLIACPGRSDSAWPNNPALNVPVRVLPSFALDVDAVSDGAGGVIICWTDNRSTIDFDIYAHHILASGQPDPAWPANGLLVCSAAGIQNEPKLVSDGAGGAIITWTDFRGNPVEPHVYAHRVLAGGTVDPAWPVNGRAVCTVAPGFQDQPTIVEDGSGGAIIAWTDFRGSDRDIYAHHVLSDGTLDPAWPVDGRALCLGPEDQDFPRIASDGAGGAIVVWRDLRPVSSTDIYAQRVLASGDVDPDWPTNGRALCTAASNQSEPRIVSNGVGGAIVVWTDNRGADEDIYAHQVRANGDLAFWPTNGLGVSVEAGNQDSPELVSDGSGGAIVTWSDLRNGGNDIYAQRVLTSGTADPTWPAQQLAVCSATDGQRKPAIVSDGAGGAIITWVDGRGGIDLDIYATHVLASGVTAPDYPTDGVALATAIDDQDLVVIVSDGARGGIAAWLDIRSGWIDVYAQRVARFGYLGSPEAEIAAVADVPSDQGGKVKVSWDASYLDTNSDPNLDGYDVLRSVPPHVAAQRLARGASAVAALDDAMRAGADRLLVTETQAQTYYWEYLTTVNALHYVSGYSYLAPTAQDSTEAGAPQTAFLVVAHNSDGSKFWASQPDSGYSVDNLAPVAPAPFTGQYASGTAYLHWEHNGEIDLAGYRLYRGPTVDFMPGPGNLISAQPDTGHVDPAGSLSYYKLSAVDIHGNEGPYTTLLPSVTVGVETGELPGRLALAPAIPSPARVSTTLRYALPRESDIALEIYDTSGRRIRTLVRGSQAAGEHAAKWDLRDDAGRGAVAGVYFAQLVAGDRSLVRRIVVME